MRLVSKTKTKAHRFINYHRNTTRSGLLKQPDKH
jgi:hypothetical protein